ncbi:LD-carboxypeptidase [Nostoc sp. PCC 7107]|uniref:S66 peptidase family protein n=1 Tax=Nostoc sp. PCC 7107 TaxID=317936 RepID=UPI0012F70ED4|nr:LD-carboxypeptidase [Nostoc sp. PCC 7107]
MLKRRKFITTFGLTTLAAQIPLAQVQGKLSPNTILKPPRLQPGDTVGLVSPAGIIDAEDLANAKRSLTQLGLKIKLGNHLLDRYGYLAGTDANRADDINTMFADNSVTAIMTMRGGWGCNRILPLLNYAQIRSHPKIIMGFSDITALVLAIYARSRVITFHGANATSTWNEFTTNYAKRILFNGEAVTMQNLQTEDVQFETIASGKATGKLIGGNLSVLAAMVGSPYLPAWYKSILFVEDVREDVYRIDRMLTQLKNAGILNQISGFIFGRCTDCSVGDEPSFKLTQVLRDHLIPLKIPAWYGSMIGHIKDKFTLPIGLNVEIDADAGTIKMLESAVY